VWNPLTGLGIASSHRTLLAMTFKKQAASPFGLAA
jgi:hypothetical protein